MIGNVPGIRTALRAHGEDIAGRALVILAAAWPGEVLRYAGTIYPGIARALAQPPAETDDEELLALVLAGASQGEWVAEIVQLAGRLGLGKELAAEAAIRAAWREAAVEDEEDELPVLDPAVREVAMQA